MKIYGGLLNVDCLSLEQDAWRTRAPKIMPGVAPPPVGNAQREGPRLVHLFRQHVANDVSAST